VSRESASLVKRDHVGRKEKLEPLVKTGSMDILVIPESLVCLVQLDLLGDLEMKDRKVQKENKEFKVLTATADIQVKLENPDHPVKKVKRVPLEFRVVQDSKVRKVL